MLRTQSVCQLAFTLAFILIIGLYDSVAKAQNTEERFQDLFKTAGYSTAFGAALGAASLAFTERPSSKLRHVAVGASLGFIGGSLLGSYIIFSPVFANNEKDVRESSEYISHRTNPNGGLSLHPVFSKHGLASLAGTLTLARF